MAFEEAQTAYAWYDARLIGREEFTRRVWTLSVRDASGTSWAIDGATGAWLRYDGHHWVPGQPAAGPGYPAQSPAGRGYWSAAWSRSVSCCFC